MAERYAVSNGNWSNTATWNGGTLPGIYDDVYANGYIVTIDQDVTCTTLNTRSGTVPVGGGTFNISGARLVKTAVYGSNVTHAQKVCLRVNEGSTLQGRSYGGTFGQMRGCIVMFGGVQNGPSKGGSAYETVGTYVENGGIQNGDSEGGGANNAFGTHLVTGGRQNGYSLGGTSNNAHGTMVETGGIQNGDAQGNNTSGAHGTRVTNGGIHNGTAAGGNVNGCYGCYVDNGGIFYGKAFAGTVSGAHGVWVNSAGVGICTQAVGYLAGRYGIVGGGYYRIVTVRELFGSYAFAPNVRTDETYDNIPFARPSSLGKSFAYLG